MSAVDTTIVPFPITNEQFLRAVFGDRWGDALVAYFLGNPDTGKNPNASFKGRPAAANLWRMAPEDNTYWDVSLPQPGGGRTVADFGAIYAIVVDDVGSKVDRVLAENILGPPHYTLRTSPHSCHCGWFIEPLTDRAWVFGLLRLLRQVLGGDNLERMNTLVRLPVGTNGKPALGPAGYRHKLEEWHPDMPRLRHTDWNDVEKRIGQVVPIDPKVSVLTGMPDPAEIEADLVLRAFRSRGMVLDHGRSMPFGWGFEVICPWASEHTDPRIDASYVPVKAKFKCHHGSCARRNPGDVREWADRVIREDSGGLESLARLEFDDIDPPIGPGQNSLLAQRALASYEATEDGLALAFAAEHKGRLRFDGKRKKWFVWTGNYWRQDDTERAFVWARALLRQYRKGVQDLTPGQARAWGKIAAARAIEQAARAQLAVDGDIWDQDIWLAGCPEGAVDLRTGGTIPPDPAHGITKQLAVAPDPAMPTPLWDKFLWEATGGDAGMIAFLQAWYGYNLTGDVSEEKFVFEYGTGGNGKGTLIYTISAILNDYAKRCDVDMFMVRKYKPHSEEVARLYGVRMVTSTESEEGRTFDVVRLKDFTGQDGKLTGRFMRTDSIDFPAQFKLTFVGNNQPRLPETDEAMRRRLILIPFTHTPAVPDITLKDRLVDEYPGILAWLIRGEILRRTSGGLGPLVPERAETATKVYLTDQDTLQRWGEERCVFDPREQMGVTEGFEAYKNWCYENNEPIQAGIRTFSRKFTAKFLICNVKSLDTKNVITGVCLAKNGDPGASAL
jgi:putative DNA primase/helicase